MTRARGVHPAKRREPSPRGRAAAFAAEVVVPLHPHVRPDLGRDGLDRGARAEAEETMARVPAHAGPDDPRVLFAWGSAVRGDHGMDLVAAPGQAAPPLEDVPPAARCPRPRLVGGHAED